MDLRAGFTRFRGQIINGVEGNQLRAMVKRLRRQLQSHRLADAEDTLDEMLQLSRSGVNPLGMKKAVRELYEEEWERAGLANT